MSAKNTAGGIGARAKDHADRGANKADNSRALQMLARVGYVVLGVLHLIIGWFAIRIATGDGGGEEASNSGALAEIADKPGGQALLWFAVAGLVGLVIWRLVGIFVEDEAKDKAKSFVLAVVYSSLAFTTATFARGASTSDGDTATDVTAKVMEQPLGVALVIAAGLVVLGVGLYSIWKGATKDFKDDLEAGAESGHAGTAIVVVGVGVALYGLYSIARAKYVSR